MARNRCSLPDGEDYSSPDKRRRMQQMQTEHIRYSGLASASKSESGPMPDTLRIGIRMRYFAMAPNNVCQKEWIAYTLYHLHDRLNNYWNLLMYFCFDDMSVERVNKARQVRYYGVPPSKPLTSESISQMQKPCMQCPIGEFRWRPTGLDPDDTNFSSMPQYIEGLIQHLGRLRTDQKLMPGIGDDFDPKFDCRIKNTYKNCIPFFVHVYKKHYKALCGMGILYHFNSFFMNIIHQGIAYNYISLEDIEDQLVIDQYRRIYEEEDKRVKGGSNN